MLPNTAFLICQNLTCDSYNPILFIDGCSADPCFKGKSSKSTPILMNSTLPSFSQTSTTIYPISSSGHENSYRLSYSAPHYNQVTDDLLCSSTQLDPLISSTTLISPYATTNILSLGRKRRSCCLEPGNPGAVNMPLKEIPRETLKYLQTLGDGKFGEVRIIQNSFMTFIIYGALDFRHVNLTQPIRAVMVTFYSHTLSHRSNNECGSSLGQIWNSLTSCVSPFCIKLEK